MVQLVVDRTLRCLFEHRRGEVETDQPAHAQLVEVQPHQTGAAPGIEHRGARAGEVKAPLGARPRRQPLHAIQVGVVLRSPLLVTLCQLLGARRRVDPRQPIVVHRAILPRAPEPIHEVRRHRHGGVIGAAQ